MSNIRTIVALCLLALVISSNITTTSESVKGDEFNNPEFVKILNNYFGCKTWKDGICAECSDHYFFNTSGICCQVNPQCKTFNRAAGICEQCYAGYAISNGQCVVTNLINSTGTGCKLWNNGKCTECSLRWYLDSNGVCQPVSDLCRTWSSNGNCLSCYGGYVISNGACIVNPDSTHPVTDPLCAQWNGSVCIKCADRAYFDANGVCRQVSDNCATWDKFDGFCLTCYNGYSLTQGVCSWSSSNTGQPADLGCKIWDWNNQKCLNCSTNWVFNSNGVCVPVSDNCRQHDSTGACSSCYKGYDLKNGQCVYSSSNSGQPADLGCKIWDWNNQKCSECSARWYFNSNGVCTPVADQCATWSNSGVCTACFSGYDLKNGQCVYSSSNTAQPGDLGCKTWDWNKQKCLECSSRWTFNSNGVCVPVSDNCATWDASGVCTACYKGYDLKNGQCVYSTSNNAQPSDLGCKTWDWNKQVCLECSSRWAFNANKVCVPVADNCATWNAAGVCTACYQGYDLKNGQCVYSSSNTAQPGDLGCKTWDWNKQKCLECSSRWTFNSNGVCVPVSDNCATWDASGVCTACYKGYDLKNGQCVYSTSNTAQPSDLGCKTWDWNKQVCLECSSRWVFNSKGVCVPVSDNCATWDNSGVCTACYKGYDLKNGQCVYSSSNTAQPGDLGCKTWDWNKQKCLECSSRWTFNSNGVCVPVSDNCATWDASGVCTACYKGYDLKNGQCVYSTSNTAQPSDLGCKTWDWNKQVCLECSSRWTFNSKGVCVPVSDNCATWDNSGVCTACYKGYDLKNGQCVYSTSNTAQPSDLGCKTWDWNKQVCLECSSRWTFNSKGVCVPVSDNCAQWNTAGACTACYKGYDLINGQCAYSTSNTAQPSDLGCKTWDWNKQVCLECSSRWVFNSKGVCVPVSDNCATWDNSGVCTACYKGYDLKNGQCVYSSSNTAQPGDLGCKTWDWNKQKCLECSSRWTFNSNGVCVPVSDNCATWDASGVCTACYKGYDLKNGQCVYSTSNTAQPSDLGCKTWDWNKQVCLECSSRWVFNSKGVCVPVADNCGQWNTAGVCTACYKGYDLKNGTCVYSTSNTAQPGDLGCKTWDWDKQKCLECSSRWSFNSNGVCVPVSDNCNQWDASGACTSCYTGYQLSNGQCQVFNSLCKTANSNGTCATCYNGYILYQGNCVPLSKLADIVLYYTACCPEKLAALKAEGRLTN